MHEINVYDYKAKRKNLAAQTENFTSLDGYGVGIQCTWLPEYVRTYVCIHLEEYSHRGDLREAVRGTLHPQQHVMGAFGLFFHCSLAAENVYT